ncbi:conjugal transfer protein TraG N-terminal domain-containing protein [Avibacterium endocarditidis]|uniref:Conjugal transfer protein TraG n=1 Tax=Avibacterium endocarditidis TaxID=380674 RepID=A0ABX4ZVG8_9PAST|nr:conjugal transfer protein TraG N-terminal domain-containing protein [Avibacterium endocarditidis]POY43180.1 conjugal transfer protein TraG [Avibacterium endocarditidis]
MNISLTVDNYFEYFLTLLGWIINNNLWDLLTQTGVFALPILFHIIGLTLKVREQGDDEGNKGKLLASWLENAIYMSFLTMILTCMPVFTVSYSTLEFNTERMENCGYTVYKPQDTGLAKLSSELSGKEATLPIWWAFTYTLSKGITHGMVAAIPCKPDLRQIRFDIQHTQITSPVLRQEVTDFVEQCFIPARSKIKRLQYELDEAQARDLDWIGSKIMLNTVGLYDTYRSKLPRTHWPYDAKRDVGLPNTGNGGYPSCKTWWSDSSVGLRARLLQQVEQSIWERLKTVSTDAQTYEEAVLRRVVSPQNIQVSSGRVYGGYGGQIADGDNGIHFDSLRKISTYATHSLGGLFAAPTFETIRQALPMLQGIMLLAINLAIPLLMVVSGYNISTAITITIVQFSVFFLTFWWELARWLDTWMYSALYLSDTHSSWNWMGIQNEFDDAVMGTVVNTLFLILPTLWMGMMGWAGVKAGNIVSAMEKGANKTGNITEKETDKIKNKLL